MKIRYILFCLLMWGASAAAAPITSQQAQQLAKAFWQQLTGCKSDAAFAEAPSVWSGLHLINRVDGEGFVIIAADDRALPILGYAEQGTLDPDHMPANLRRWLESYNEQVLLACQQETPSMLDRPMPKETDSVPALLTTTWDQGMYYNNECPAIQSSHGHVDPSLNGHVYTGCTATAMAQVMKYWNWPPHGIGSHSYNYDNSGYSWSYGTLSADFEHTAYAWDSMPNKLTSSCSQAQIDAVAILIYHCGVGAEMWYDKDGSGAYMSIMDMEAEWEQGEYCAESALYTFFGYKDTVRGLAKDSYADTTWTRMLKEELRAGRPVIYQGYITGWDAGGHCFVLDGYNAEGKFHVNWGWSGDYDGYFAISALNPDGYYNYSSQQEGLFYVEPDYALFDNDTTGGDTSHVALQRIQGEPTTVWSMPGGIRISGALGQPCLVTDIMGREMARIRSLAESERIAVPAAGIYLVRIGNETRKVLVRQ